LAVATELVELFTGLWRGHLDQTEDLCDGLAQAIVLGRDFGAKGL